MALNDAETPPPTQYVRSAGDFSPSSVETTFRELDDVFLQTQTRIWLGEVLGTILDERVSITELLSDGELLFEVSRVIWEMILTRRMEHGHSKPFKHDDPFASRKGSGRYTPYCNVDSFLKTCKTLGLSGIDLFSPSDVVEKKNTRKVCICVRLLSKKARFKELNVPDFDIVTCTVSMPTDMVGLIRQSLELSYFSSSRSANYSGPCHRVATKTRKKHSIAAVANGLYSEDTDSTESNLVESVVPHDCLQDMSYEDYQQNSPIVGKKSNANSRDENRYERSPWETNSFLVDLSNRSFSDEYLWDSVTPERRWVPCQPGIPGDTDHQSSADDAQVISGSYASNFCSYEASTSSPPINEIRCKFNDEYLEVSSVSSTNSVSGPLRIDFCNEHDSGNTYEDVEVSEIGNSKSEQPEKLDCIAKLGDGDDEDHVMWSVQGDEDKVVLTVAVTSNGVDFRQYNHLLHNDRTNFIKSVSRTPVDESHGMQTQDATLQPVAATRQLNAVDGSSSYEGCDFVTELHSSESSNSSYVPHEENVEDRSQKTKSPQAQDMNPCFHQDDTEAIISEVLIKQHSNINDNLQSLTPSDEKPQKRPLLRSIVRGSAILSVMFLVLQFRKSSMEKGKGSAPSSQKQGTNAASVSLQKRRSGGAQKAVYPAQKLNFG